MKTVFQPPVVEYDIYETTGRFKTIHKKRYNRSTNRKEVTNYKQSITF